MSTKRSPMETRDVAALIIGLEAGAGIGILAFGTTPLAPLGLAVAGAAAGFGIRRGRHALFRLWVRSQLRAAR